MFALGYLWVGDYKIWITTPIFSVHPSASEAEKLPYYEVFLLKKMLTWPDHYSYVDPIKNIFQWDMTDRNPLSKPKDKERLVQDELEFRVEQSSYLDRKSMTMPLVKLSRRHIEELLQRLCQPDPIR